MNSVKSLITRINLSSQHPLIKITNYIVKFTLFYLIQKRSDYYKHIPYRGIGIVRSTIKIHSTCKNSSHD